MYTLHGFFNYGPLIDNVRDQVNVFGELSDDSMTYAKDKAYISHSDYPQTVLVGFHSVKDDSPLQVPGTLGLRAVQLGNWLFNRAISGSITTDPNALRSALQGEFGGYTINIELGHIISDGNVRLPEWIEYTDTEYEDSENTIKIWFSDQSFRSQYPNYHIEVIPPFEPVDDMFLPPNDIRRRIAAMSLTTQFEKVQALRGEYPYTLVQVHTYEYISPVDEDDRIETPWTVLIYGRAGNNPDLIKEAIVDWILEHSDKTREEWEEIIPDLFLNTEYLITPLWHQYSVPNLELEAGIYSPIIKPDEVLDLLKVSTVGDKYTDAWITKNHEITGVQYKSLMFGVVGSPDNRDDITGFYERFPDYMLVTNDSSDFNRMSVRTQDFVIMLSNLFKVAEEITNTSTVPLGMSRINRDGVVYIAQHFNNILYLVATKQTVEELTGSV